ncbi:MAG: hypothetical protein PW786_10855, partial [Arachidicoccus sp.]|nr:hypothetical protein [Arachidicoccus sp.]
RLLIVDPETNIPLVDTWKTDGDNSLYDAFKAQHLDLIDNFTTPVTAVFIYKKNDQSFVPVQQMTSNDHDNLSVIQDLYGKDTLGYVTSPRFGPSLAWKSLQWNGYSRKPELIIMITRP